MRNIKNIPTEIYLQIGAGADECGDFAALTSSDVTWHTERIFANDIRYVLPKDVKTKGRKKIYISDAIYLLDGWETSKGAKLEFDVASTCGLRIYYQSNKVINQ